MKITDALVEIKKKKEQISRLYDIRQQNFRVIIPKHITIKDALANASEHVIITFDEVTGRITALEEALSTLRERILRTNVSTSVKMEDGKEVTLSMLKLMVDNYRSRLAQLMALKSSGRFYVRDMRKISSADDEEKEAVQLNDLELDDMISKFEDEKSKLQGLLDTTNAKTELVD